MIEHFDYKDIYTKYREDADKILDRINAIKGIMRYVKDASDRDVLVQRLNLLEKDYENIVYAMRLMRSDKL